LLLSILSFLLVGVFAGGVAGLLGLGGGTVVVPALILIFSHAGVPHEVIFHFAVGTSFAIMIVTTSVSAWTRAKQGDVLWPVVRRLLPGILVGVVLGAVLANHLSTSVLKLCFAIFLLLVASRMFFNIQPRFVRELPGKSILFVISGCIGLVSGLLGIGVGSMTVPYLTRHNIKMRLASGIASACTVPLAVAGTASFLITGWHFSGVNHSIGYVDWLAFLLVSPTSVVTASFAVKFSARLKTGLLKRVFAVFLLIVAVGLIFGH
tara:strand:+ start:1163 stop:1954 length:792 start_codon:yes stop_codon:yes gene_type:complete